MDSIFTDFITYLQTCEKKNKIDVEEARLKFETIVAGIVAATPEPTPPSPPPSSIIGSCFPPFSAGSLTDLFKAIKGLKHLKMDTSDDGKTVDAESEIITANGTFVITAKYSAKEQVNSPPAQPQT